MNYRTLLPMSILAGMATAAIIVLLMALHPIARSQSVPVNQPVQTSRPSPFGAPAASAMPPDTKLTPPQLAKKGNQAVVIVTGYDAGDQPVGQAIGYVYSSSGIIVTTYSAIKGASSVTIETPGGGELNVIALMGYSTVRDLAVLAVLEGNLTALENGASEVVKEGDSVFVTGTPATIGPRRAVNGVDLIQISTQAAPGSPVLNDHGKVIAMVTQRAAIPSHYISDLLAEHRTLSFAQMLQETAHL